MTCREAGRISYLTDYDQDRWTISTKVYWLMVFFIIKSVIYNKPAVHLLIIVLDPKKSKDMYLLEFHNLCANTGMSAIHPRWMISTLNDGQGKAIKNVIH